MTMVETNADDAPKRTAAEVVRSEIKRRILNFELQPGERLHIDNLRREFDVSTATMREALSRLLTDNLVTSERQRGFQVRELSYEDYKNISEARKLVETGALRASLANRDDNWEGDLFAAYRKLKLIENRMIAEGDMNLADEWHRRNSGFHDCLIRNCRNTWLTEFRHQLHEHSIRYNRLAVMNNRKHRDVRKEHAAIFESAIEGDVDLCSRLVGEHIEHTIQDIAKYLPRSSEELAKYIAAYRKSIATSGSARPVNGLRQSHDGGGQGGRPRDC